MAYTDIDNPAIYFNTVVYTGNDSTQSITGVGFQPDLVWGKNRATVTHHAWQDSVRGNTKVLKSSTNNAEATITNMVTSFDSDGFSLGSDSDMNEGSGKSMVAWNWKESATAGFDIVSYTGNGSNRTISHNLSAIPGMYIVKDRTSGTTNNWYVYHQSLGNTKRLRLDLTNDGGTEANAWNDTSPTSSNFSLGTNGNVNTNNNTYIAYVFAEKKGYSKFGSYTGNGSGTAGSYIYTGFKPSWLMVKQTDTGGEGWYMWDNKRSSSGGANENDRYLIASATSAEGTLGVDCDFLSNGFKHYYSADASNGDGHSYVYMAFAEAPLVNSNGVPCNAR